MNEKNAKTSSEPRVLLVDDCDLTRTLLRSILRDNRYDVIGEARNGVVALELAERLRPDIVCLDVMMPEMDGLETLQAIRVMYPETVVVMVTGNPSADAVRESIQAGASGFIIKPFKAGTLLDTVGRAWQSARQSTPSASRQTA